MHPWIVLQLLIVLAAANGAPVIAKKIFGERYARPLDGGLKFYDGRPVFGPSKTFRGLVAAVFAAAVAAALVGLPLAVGVVAGAGAMTGDLISSFIKRRMGKAPSSRATGLDQIPESVIPLFLCAFPLGLSLVDIAAGTIAFTVGEMILSPLLFRLGIRSRPY
jgi:hypothetical protein